MIEYLLSFLYATSTPPYIQKNDLPPRIEWEENYGYCGETSFITAGLYYGQYCSQYTARSIACNGAGQASRSDQLIVGRNEDRAAQGMRLKYEKWAHEGESSPPQATTDDFFVWIKKNVSLGYPVVIGLFNNESIFYNNSDPNAGQSDYDHLVVVTGFGSLAPLNEAKYFGSDRIYFIDNGLYTPDDVNPIYYFDSDCDSFRLTRQEANNPNGPVYSLISAPNHYGVAILGVADDDHVTLPVKLTTSVNCEVPEIVDGSDTAPDPKPLTLTVSVSGLTPGADYILYYYDDFTKVPTKSFNASSAQVKQKVMIHATATTYTTTIDIMSNEVAVFRAVHVDAP
jgi:hypothetical protein